MIWILKPKVLGGPHLVLAHFGCDKAIFAIFGQNFETL